MVKRSSDIERAAARFLRTGKMGTIDPGELAAACNKIVRAKTQSSIPEAKRLAREFLKYSRGIDGISPDIPLRTQAWVLHSSGDYRGALRSYLKARDIVTRDRVTRAKIDRILIDVYMYLEEFTSASRHARQALATFKQLGAAKEAAMTRVNYGNLFHRQDRHQEAYDQYDQARKVLEREGGELVQGLCYYNLANASVQLFKFDQAEELYKRCRDKFDKLGYHLYVNETDYGLAWLLILQGDYYRALEQLAECEKSYKETGQPRGEVLCQLDRAEAYLSLNLFSEALTQAGRAIKGASRLKLSYEAAKGAFFKSLAARSLGRIKTAETALELAINHFKAAKNPAFVSVAQLLSLAKGEPTKRQISSLKKLRSGLSKAQLPLWEGICDLNLLAIMGDDRDLMARLKKNRAVQAVPHLNSRWRTYLGDRAARSGQSKKAIKHWSEAAELLEAVRAQLPPVEIRSALIRSQGDPLYRLIDAEADTNPAEAAAWSERLKTTGLWTAPTDRLAVDPDRKVVERSLARLSSQVSALSTRVTKKTGRPTRLQSSGVGNVEKFQAEASRRWHQLCSDQMVSRAIQSDIMEDVARASQDRTILQFHCDDQDIIAFVHKDGETRVCRLPNGTRLASEFAGCWSVSLSRSLLSNGRISRRDLEDEARAFTDLGDWLWAPLEISSDETKILIVPEGRLSNIPWLALRYQGQALAERHQIVNSPSIRHHTRATAVKVKGDRIELFVGRSEGLRAIKSELAHLSDAAKGELTIHKDCRFGNWPNRSEARLWHYAGHADFRSDNPFYSSLQLSDRPIFAADFRMMDNRVGLVTLAACRTGCQSILPGEESTGLVRSLLEMGARNVVGSHWSVADRTSSQWMTHFYKYIFGGRSVAESIRRASLKTRKQYPSAYDWAAFSVFGAG